jgi:hypothetical protein
MTSWHTYPKIYSLGHGVIQDIFLDPVIIEEKVDGSQFSFGVFDGELKARSKGQQLIIEAPEKMFTRAIEVIQELKPLLKDGYTYRGEYLNKPKHNALAYDRAPKNNIIIFDISPAQEVYLPYADKKAEAERIGLETVPIVFEGMVTDYNMFKALMETVSVLGGQKVEGVVVKNYKRFANDGKVFLGKYVSEAFKEVHGKNWKETNPSSGEFHLMLAEQYKTPARWNKAVQHLKEAGKLTGTPSDIGPLLKEVQADIEAECADEIKQKLFEHFFPTVKRVAIRGLPEWYKDELAKTSNFKVD